MGQVQNSVVISAPINQVYLFHTQVKNLVDMISGTIDIEMLSAETEFKKGYELEFYLGRFGINRRCKILVEELLASQKIEIKQSLGLFKSYRHVVEFTDHGSGKTLVSDYISYRLPFGLLGYLADDLFFRNDLQKIIDQRYRRLEAKFSAINP